MHTTKNTRHLFSYIRDSDPLEAFFSPRRRAKDGITQQLYTILTYTHIPFLVV